jgi:hypothetical protein
MTADDNSVTGDNSAMDDNSATDDSSVAVAAKARLEEVRLAFSIYKLYLKEQVTRESDFALVSAFL